MMARNSLKYRAIDLHERAEKRAEESLAMARQLTEEQPGNAEVWRTLGQDAGVAHAADEGQFVAVSGF